MVYMSEGQKEEMFTAATKEMMKMCVVDAYLKKDELKVVAPTSAMENVRNFAQKMHDASAVAREKCTDAMGSATDTANELAEAAKEKAEEKGGMLGGMLGSAAAMVTDLAGSAANVAASAAGLAAEKAIKGVAVAMDASINALDDPFEKVGKDIFHEKQAEIINKYASIINGCRIPKAVEVVRGAEPFGAAEYANCKPSKCCDTLQNVCKDDIHKGLHEVVQEEINKHAVTKAWDLMIENYNKCNEKLGEYPILKEMQTEPIKLDINKYIVEEVAAQFHELMCKREAEIRQSPEGKSKEMPRTFHLCFGGEPAYDAFTMEHYANFRKTN